MSFDNHANKMLLAHGRDADDATSCCTLTGWTKVPLPPNIIFAAICDTASVGWYLSQKRWLLRLGHRGAEKLHPDAPNCPSPQHAVSSTVKSVQKKKTKH